MIPIIMNARGREVNLRLIRERRNTRNASQPFNLPDRRFIELFRLNKAATENLITILEPHLHHPSRAHGIPPKIAVFAVLRFYATGCYQRSIGQDINFGLSQTSVHRCIKLVTAAIVEYLSPRYIKFPETRLQRQEIKASFMEKYGFPGIVGAIDCTHVAILKPTVEEHNFINRKGYHSINVQAVCDDKLIITSINTNYGGSTHDAFIWRNSQLQNFLHQLYVDGERNTWLIGDSRYGLQPYLLTPVHNPPPESPEAAYNSAHIVARNCIERCFGLLKMRFRCILKERVARYSPDFVAKLIIACAVLHNICVKENVPLLGDANDALPDEDVINNHPNPVAVENNNLLEQGRQTRQRLINMYFV